MILKSKIPVIICLLALSTTPIFAQQVSIPSCTDEKIHAKVVTTNGEYEAKGYKINLTKNILIPNGGIQPVTVKVQKGKQYIVNYFSQSDAKKIRMTIWDENKKEIYTQKGKTGQQLTASFVSSYDGFMYIFLTQKTKNKKEVCGGISVMEK